MKRHFSNFEQFIISRQRLLTRFKYWGLAILLIVVCWGIPATAEWNISQENHNSSSILAQNSNLTPSALSLQRPTLELGSQGTEVSELQATLKLLGYYDGAVDGVYSEATAEAVSAFQKAAGIGTSGVVNQQTWNSLFPPSQTSQESSTTSTCVCQTSTSASLTGSGAATNRRSPVNFPILQLGMRGDAVTGLQERLRAKGFLRSPIDGVFGSETQAAVEAAQTEYELKSDGVVGAQTWLALLR
ncbi:MAG: peptidoglycan-binding protein [Microcoleaceae cyanobacterium]